MSCKSAIYTASTGPVTVASGGTIPLGSRITWYGNSIALNGNTIACNKQGFYNVNVSITANPTIAGTVTATLYKNGVPYPGATVSDSVTTAGNPVSLPINTQIRVPCDGNTAALTLVLTGNASIVNNTAITVEKV
jgi:hypothetical protein